MLTIVSVQVNNFQRSVGEEERTDHWRLFSCVFWNRGNHTMDSACLQKICTGWRQGSFSRVRHWRRWCRDVGGIQHGRSRQTRHFWWEYRSGGSGARVPPTCTLRFLYEHSHSSLIFLSLLHFFSCRLPAPPEGEEALWLCWCGRHTWPERHRVPRFHSPIWSGSHGCKTSSDRTSDRSSSHKVSPAVFFSPLTRILPLKTYWVNMTLITTVSSV